MSLSKDDVLAMLQKQDQANRVRNKCWLYAGYPFLRGIVFGGAEVVPCNGSLDPQFPPDIQKLRLALVEMWGAMLSTFIVKARGNLEYAASAIITAAKPHTGVTGAVVFDGVEYHFGDHKLSMKLELLIGLAAARRISLPLFEAVMVECDLSWDELVRRYLDADKRDVTEADRKELACT